MDSTALLWHMVLRFGSESCVAVYFDHGFRSNAVLSAERATVRQTAKALNVRLIVRKLPVRAYMSRYGTGPEVTGRYLRYSLLAHFKKILRCDAVVTAHHQDDAAESALMQLGSGALFGMQGMRAHTRWGGTCDVYHPMWKIRKNMIRACLKDSGLSHSEDASNGDTAIRRNHVRHGVLPEAEAVFPHFSEKIVRFGEWMGTLSDYIAAQIPASLTCFSDSDEGYRSIDSLLGFDMLHQIEKEWLSRYWLMHYRPDTGSRIMRPQLRFSEAHVQALIAVASQQRPRISLPGNTTAWREGRRLCFSTTELSQNMPCGLRAPEKLVVAPGEIHFQTLGVMLTIRAETHVVGTDFPPSWKRPWVAAMSEVCLPAGTVLDMRHRQAGDRFRPLGLSHSLSLKRFLIHRKFPEKWRGHLPLFFLGSELVWVPFLGVSDRFRIGKSETLWVFELSPLDDRFQPVFNHYNGM